MNSKAEEITDAAQGRERERDLHGLENVYIYIYIYREREREREI